MNILPLALSACLLCYAIPIAPSTHNNTNSLTSSIHTPTSIHQLIAKHAKSKAIPIALVTRIVKQESSFNPKAKRYEPSLRAHSLGLMQIMDNYWVNSKTCPFIKAPADLLDADLNLKCGTSILRSLLSKYPSTKDALIAYNGGENCFLSPKCLTQSSLYAEKILS
jgi:hypothetical protein